MNARSYVPPDVSGIISRVTRRFKRRSCPVRATAEAQPRDNHDETENDAIPQPNDRPGGLDLLHPDRPLNRILVPIDFSPCTAQAVEHAATLASERAANITLLHIVNVNPPDSAHWAGSAQTLMAKLWSEAHGRMGRLTALLSARHIEPQTVIEEGLPWERIVEKSRDFDLVVLGKDPARHAKIFSQQTVQRVMRDAHCPVVVVSGLSAVSRPF